MGFMGFGSTNSDADAARTTTDAVDSDPAALEERAGLTGRALITALDRAVKMQTSAITGYVAWLRSKNPDASPAQIQKIMDKHFKTLASGTGASAGAAAAVPGIGFITGAAAVGADSLVFLDSAAFYTMASAHLRGVDIRHAERRRALILVVLLGSAGTLIVDAAVGDLGSEKGASVAATITRFGAPNLSSVNSKLMKTATKRMTKKMRGAWLGKMMPLGIGAVLGTMANRKLADRVIHNGRDSLGPLPAQFSEAAPQPGAVAEPQVAAEG